MLHDLRLALRSLGRRPGFAVVVVLTLGLGLGAASLIFAAVDAVVLRPLPFPQADSLVQVGRTTSVSKAHLEALARQVEGFASFAAYFPWNSSAAASWPPASPWAPAGCASCAC